MNEHDPYRPTTPHELKEPHMASTEEIRTDLAEIVEEVAGVSADQVQLDKSFVDDLDVDSLSMVEVVVAAEEKFDVKIPDDEVKNLKTVGDAVAFIERAQNG
jgi:acyl carrier protein